MNPLPVLFLTYGFPVGGAETFFVNLVNNLDRTKIKPIVVSLGQSEALESKLKSGINIVKTPRRWRYDLSPASKLRELILANGVTTVVALDFFCAFYVSLAIRKIPTPMNVLVSLHMTKPRSFKDFANNFVYSRFLTGKEKLVTVCQAQAAYLSSLYKISRQQLQVIYNGVDVNYWTPVTNTEDRTSLRKMFSVPSDAQIVLQVAAFRREKKHEDSIQALKILHNQGASKTYLMLVGGGNLVIENRLKKLTADLQLGDYVQFCGSHADVREFYWMADLFTLSSVSIETFSIAALEAMAAGLPCVITDLGGAREMVFDGKNGYVVPRKSPERLAEAWSKALNGMLSWKSREIREYVADRFSLEQCVHQYENAIIKS